ncbi:MAG: hypothetical protein ACOVP8_14040, partial [Phycisphaerales bacterium]
MRYPSPVAFASSDPFLAPAFTSRGNHKNGFTRPILSSRSIIPSIATAHLSPARATYRIARIPGLHSTTGCTHRGSSIPATNRSNRSTTRARCSGGRRQGLPAQQRVTQQPGLGGGRGHERIIQQQRPRRVVHE